MRTNEIREKFLEFFREREHTVVPSDLLLPRNDPTLLFTGAGMNQFKNQFMGKNITYTRAASCQKCLRTGDLENVGKTPRHHTFFEMLGNFSFGDYFKKEAIRWGWEFMTKTLNIPGERLWVSVYEKDDEAYGIWLKDVKVSKERIVKLGTHDNFWPQDAPTQGPNGPCGPCSEIFYDWGEETGCGEEGCGPACDCGRFVEVWNLVFTEFDRQPDGSLKSLPSKNIDTGMGLERIASVMQGVRTNFEIDSLKPLVDQIRKETGGKIPAGDCNLIADHLRAAVFAIGDAISPSNEKSGYVVRKLIRRAYLKSGKARPFLYNLVPKVTGLMEDAYPETEEKREHISAIVEQEEKKFSDTLNAAMPILDEILAVKPGVVSGEDVFRLVDTYGMPLEVIEQVSAAAGADVDEEKFRQLMDYRKEQSRRGSAMASDFIFQPDLFAGAPKPPFSEDMPLEASVEFIIKDDTAADEIGEGERAEIVVSPQSARFYAEAGGQTGDSGYILKKGAKLKIVNTFESDGRKVFCVYAEEGAFKKKDKVTVELDANIKADTAKNHTATHLLQAALRSVLGDHIKQSGSYVDDKRFRFDFTHMKKMSEEELLKVQDMVNSWVEGGIDVCKELRSLRDAKKEGALSFFGEKYGDTVRVVSIPGASKELCGGTHVDNTGEIGVVKVVAESSIASGLRRIEAVTGANAEKWIRETATELLDRYAALSAASNIKMDPAIERDAGDIASGKARIGAGAVHDFDKRIRPAFLRIFEELEKEAKKLQKEKQAESFDAMKNRLDGIAKAPEEISGVKFISGVFKGLGMPLLKKAVSYVEKKAGEAVILLGGSEEGKAYLICAVTPDLEKKGISAQDIVKNAAGKISGSGGGKLTFAQAGGSDPSGLAAAIEEAKRIIKGRAG